MTVKAKGRRRTRCITRAEAQRIAAKHDSAWRFDGVPVTSLKSWQGDGILSYYYNVLGRPDWWLVFPKSDGRLLGASYVICVDKATGKVMFTGRVGE